MFCLEDKKKKKFKKGSRQMMVTRVVSKFNEHVLSNLDMFGHNFVCLEPGRVRGTCTHCGF